MRKHLPVVFFVFLTFLISAPAASAQTTSPYYYDWGATLETSQKDVLGIAHAQESTPSAQKSGSTPAKYTQFNRYFFGGNLMPGNPFYFLKPLQENIQLVLTFDKKAKDKLRVEIAGERLNEMQGLAASKNVAAIAAVANSYQQTMSAVADDVTLLKKQNVNEDDLIKQVEEETAKHDVILEQVRVQVPDQAEAALDKALEASWKGTDTVADLKNRPAVPPDVVSRLQSLKSQGLLTQEEVTKLVGVKSRIEARTEIGKYVSQGVVSSSDFLRMNETAKTFYPDEFYKIHETLRFQELQKLESEKPDSATLNKIQIFAKNYKPGDQVPSELRKYWVPVVRLEEIQNTLRPDLIDASLFKQNGTESKKFNEVVERFKPRPEDVAFVKNFIQKNNADVNNLPPEYQRMYNLAEKYGAQCGAGFNWVPESQNPAGGYCAPNGANISNTPKFNDFARGKSCSGSIVSAKGSAGACSAYPSDCVPPGWSKTDSCVATPTTRPGQGSATNQKISCPSNAHFVSVSYDPNGGYCIPNYTQVGFDQSTGAQNSVCQSGYHRSYAGGPCIQDYSTSTFNNPFSLPPLTTTPGGPYYTNSGRCGQSSHWVPEPINPNGGYCVTDSYQAPNQRPFPGNGEPKVDMGNCRTPGECYDFCKSNPGTPSCSGFNPSQQRPGDAPSKESQEAACRSGGGTCTSWNNGACGCTYGGSGSNTNNIAPYGSPSKESQEAACRSGGGICTGWYNGACSCTHSGSGNTNNGTSSESQEAACRSGGGTCTSWNNGACGCTYNSSGGSTGGSTSPTSANPSGGCSNYTPGMCGGSSGAYFDFSSCSCKTNSYTPPPSGSSTPPSGYGSCGSDQYWNGSACISNSTSTAPAPSSQPSSPPSSGGSSPQPSSPPSSGGSSPQTAPPPPAPESAPPPPAPAASP